MFRPPLRKSCWLWLEYKLGCVTELDWTTGLDYWTGLLDWTPSNIESLVIYQYSVAYLQVHLHEIKINMLIGLVLVPVAHLSFVAMY